MVFGLYGFARRKPKRKRVWVTRPNGKKKQIKVRVNKPKNCSTPRRICVMCKKTRIHKLSRFYDSKICETCTPSDSVSRRDPDAPVGGLSGSSGGG